MRRGGDSNPRGPYEPAGLANRCIQPLCHLSSIHHSHLRTVPMSTTSNYFLYCPGCSKRATAEREGFEPPAPLRGLRFSRPAQSTTLPNLRIDAYRPAFNLSATRTPKRPRRDSNPRTHSFRLCGPTIASLYVKIVGRLFTI